MTKSSKWGGAVLAVALLAGCAGTDFDWASARRIKVGMTERELVELMGPPYMVRSGPDGQTWVWSHASLVSGQTRSVAVSLKDGAVSQAPSIPDAFK